MATFRIGQRVVCVAHLEPREAAEIDAGVKLPKPYRIYTVRSIRPVLTYTGTFEGVRLREIVNPELPYLGGADISEISFAASDFRPLISDQTDISVFERLLRPADSDQLVREGA